MLSAAVAAKTWPSPGRAQALVALRTVGGHGVEIAALAPDDVLVEPVEQGARGGQRARRLEGRVDHASGDGVERRRAREAP